MTVGLEVQRKGLASWKDVLIQEAPLSDKKVPVPSSEHTSENTARQPEPRRCSQTFKAFTCECKIRGRKKSRFLPRWNVRKDKEAQERDWKSNNCIHDEEPSILSQYVMTSSIEEIVSSPPPCEPMHTI